MRVRKGVGRECLSSTDETGSVEWLRPEWPAPGRMTWYESFVHRAGCPAGRPHGTGPGAEALVRAGPAGPGPGPDLLGHADVRLHGLAARPRPAGDRRARTE